MARVVCLHGCISFLVALPSLLRRRECSAACIVRHVASHEVSFSSITGSQVTGKCGSVTVRLVPAPRGSGIVAARVPKKVLQFAGIEDVFTSSRGSTKTLGNFVKVGASQEVHN